MFTRTVVTVSFCLEYVLGYISFDVRLLRIDSVLLLSVTTYLLEVIGFVVITRVLVMSKLYSTHVVRSGLYQFIPNPPWLITSSLTSIAQ